MHRFTIFCFILVAASSLMASNMGFKLSYSLTNSGTSTNWVSLPYFWGSSATSATVCSDVGTGTQATEVGMYDPASNSFSPTWACGDTSNTPWGLTAGKAIYVKVSSGTTWTIVGSHDPSLALPLTNAGTSTNWVSIPYHTTATDSQTICTQVGGNATEVGAYDPATNAFTPTWACGDTSNTPWALTVGKGYYIKVSAVTNWTPAHY
jgi:hypothetical protein